MMSTPRNKDQHTGIRKIKGEKNSALGEFDGENIIALSFYSSRLIQ